MLDTTSITAFPTIHPQSIYHISTLHLPYTYHTPAVYQPHNRHLLPSTHTNNSTSPPLPPPPSPTTSQAFALSRSAAGLALWSFACPQRKRKPDRGGSIHFTHTHTPPKKTASTEMASFDLISNDHFGHLFSSLYHLTWALGYRCLCSDTIYGPVQRAGACAHVPSADRGPSAGDKRYSWAGGVF